MNTLSPCYATDPTPSLFLRNLTSQRSLHFCSSLSFNFSNAVRLAISSKSPLQSPPSRRWIIRACSAASSEIDMVKNKEGIYTPKQKKVVVLWDLDNKPPRGPPYDAAMALKQVAQRFGEVVDMSAYANRHAFTHLPGWVLNERREQKQTDIMERKGLITPSEPYVCGMCGRKCKTSLDLKKHFKQLHQREHQKKMNRMRSLKGKKRQRFKARFISGNDKYNQTARSLITPKVGYGLASELRRAGVFVKTVEDKPQAADWAVKKQIKHSMSRGIDWLFLVSDDSDFSAMLRRAREANLGTVVVGDWDRALGRDADLWVPWIGVENGEVAEIDLVPKNRRETFAADDGFFSVSHGDGDTVISSELDGIVDELVAVRSEFNDLRNATFSDEDEEQGWFSDDLDEDYMLVIDEDEDEETEDEFD